MTGKDSAVEAGEIRPFWRDPSAWSRIADVVAILAVVSLPWSTSLLSIFLVIWILVVAPSIDVRAFMRSLKRPVCALPIALFALAVVGTLWSQAPWNARMYYVGPTAKLVVLPLLIFHFERSPAGLKVFAAFLTSCTLLLVLSWSMYAFPAWASHVQNSLGMRPSGYAGLPVKNYITQSQEFVVCAFGCAIATLIAWKHGRKLVGTCLALLGAGFLANPLFVVSARTALVTVPVVALVLTARCLSRRAAILVMILMTAFIMIFWTYSPYFRTRLGDIRAGYEQSVGESTINSSGLRLEFWQKSLEFLREAPLIGHGTGSVRGLFERAAIGKTGLAAEAVSNPHNQTLYFGIQWGSLGIALLFAMWGAHYWMFHGNGWGSWLGTLVVVQNIVGSVFNSHLSDFVEGWIYVIGVGIAGGMLRSGFDGDWRAETVNRFRPLSRSHCSK